MSNMNHTSIKTNWFFTVGVVTRLLFVVVAVVVDDDDDNNGANTHNTDNIIYWMYCF